MVVAGRTGVADEVVVADVVVTDCMMIGIWEVVVGLTGVVEEVVTAGVVGVVVVAGHSTQPAGGVLMACTAMEVVSGLTGVMVLDETAPPPQAPHI